ncbi:MULTISPECIES: thiamine phosphate synthase [Brevundimonas]|uniref:thiamine phosphate synthase n=1 Tax=Brevundimonas TaxID=41275 RepID=UPI001FB51129|nr:MULTISPECIES: thiamine phosphate synthase [Brevundimonas]MDM8352586.1 thiamine phosphate synthase [Brevundimonas diminuta]
MTLSELMAEDARTLWATAQALSQSVALTAAPVSPRPLPPLLFFTDPERTPRPWETAARLPAGAGVVYRAFGAADAVETGLRLREATRAAGGLLLVGLDAVLAERVEADGVHLPERALSSAYALSGRRPDWLLTGAAHSEAAVRGARDLHALVLSPVFTAGGASAAKPALGVKVFSDLAALASCPAYALGGITARNAEALSESGACGLAGVEAIQTAFTSR